LAGLRFKCDPSTGLLSLIQHVYDNGFCSEVVKASDETEENCSIVMLRAGEHIQIVELVPQTQTTHRILFRLQDERVFA
jgi:hypothetical protein